MKKLSYLSCNMTFIPNFMNIDKLADITCKFVYACIIITGRTDHWIDACSSDKKRRSLVIGAHCVRFRATDILVSDYVSFLKFDCRKNKFHVKNLRFILLFYFLWFN
jgi:hypothetical protein